MPLFNTLFDSPIQPVGYPQVNTFGDLPPAADYSGEIYTVLQGSGVYLINRKSAGLYYSDGASWSRLGNIPAYFDDANFKVYNTSDNTKQIALDASGITTSTTRTLTAQDKDHIIGDTLLDGQPGGQNLNGGTGSGENLTLNSTTDATKGLIILGSTSGAVFDEVNNRFAVGIDATVNNITINGASLGSTITANTEGATDLAEHAIHRHSDTAGFGAHSIFARSRGTEAGQTVVQDGDYILRIDGVAHDGTDYAIAGQIDLIIEGTPGSNDMPGAWLFSTTPDGASSPSERMRIGPDGLVTFSEAILLTHTATEADDNAIEIDLFASGFGDVKALDIVYNTGAISAGDDEAVILINVDDSSATGGDVSGLEILATEGSAQINGLFAGALVNPVEQLAGTFENVDTGLVNAVDQTTAFNTAGTDVEFFTNDNDTITIGKATKFEEIEFLLATVASQNVNPTFEYSTGVGTWATFSPVDGTNGFRNSGVVAWLDGDIPSWALGTGSEYLIRVTRTRNNLPTPPIESKIQVASVNEYYWNKDGNLLINGLTTNGQILVDDTTDSTSPTTGSIQTDGGLGVAKSAFFGGGIDIETSTFPAFKSTATTSNTSNTATVFICKRKTSGDMVDTFGANFQFRIEDDAGVENIIARVDAQRDGADNVGTLTLKAGNNGNGDFIRCLGNDDKVQIPRDTDITSSTESTSPTTGALIISGGLGVAKNAFFGGSVTIDSAAPTLNLEATTGVAAIEIGKGRTGNNSSYIDFVTNTGDPDFNARIIKATDGNGSFDIQNKGTGAVRVLNDTDGVELLDGATAWSAISDKRKKEDIDILTGGLDKLDKINPYYFKYKTDNADVRRRVGVIAQEIQEVLPEAVGVDEDGFLNVRYTELIPMLISSIKELKEQING